MKTSLFLLLAFFAALVQLPAQTTSQINTFLQPSAVKDALALVTVQSFDEKTFVLDQEALEQQGGISFLQNILALDESHSFSVIYNAITGVELNKKTIKYQHLYQGIPVEGSGYTIVIDGDTDGTANILSRAVPGGPVGPNPCTSVNLMNFYVSEIDEKMIAVSNQGTLTYNDLTSIANELNVNATNLTSRIFLRWIEHLKNTTI